MITRTAAAVVIAALQLLRVGPAQSEEQPPSARQEFAKRFSKLNINMTAKEAEQIAGPPEEKRAAVLGPDQKARLWCYGVEQGVLPTLGSFVIDKRGRVRDIFGIGFSAVHAPDSQEELVRQAMFAIDYIGDVKGNRYDPLSMIQAVNLLLQLGKDEAIAVVEEYLRVVPYDPPQSGRVALLVLRLLFAPDDGRPPRISLGAPSPDEPTSAKLVRELPLFPLVVVGDIPFLAISNYQNQGALAPTEASIDYYRKHGILRSAPLRPIDNPQRLFSKVQRSAWWQIYSADEQRGQYIIACQLLRLERFVVPVISNFVAEAEINSPQAVLEKWSGTEELLDRIGVVWDDAKSNYVGQSR